MAVFSAVTVQGGGLAQAKAADQVGVGTGVSATSGVFTAGLTTAGLAVGDVGYLVAASTMAKTDALVAASSRAFGVNQGLAGAMQTQGVVAVVNATTAGGAPAVGAPLYLALSTDDAGAGAGKVTATLPTSGVIAQVGFCIDPAGYAGAKTVKMLWLPPSGASLAAYLDTSRLLMASTVQAAIDSAKRNLLVHLRNVVPGAVGEVNKITRAGLYPYVPATVDVIVLPDTLKAVQNPQGFPVSGIARTGTAVGGTLLVSASQTAPAGINYSSSSSGDLVTNATSAWTNLDAYYLPERQDPVEYVGLVVNPATGVVAGLPALTMISMMEAEATLGGAIGKKVVGPVSAAAPAAGNACMTADRSGVLFAIADAVTECRVKVGVVATVNY